MPVLDFGAEDALRVADAATPRAVRVEGPPEAESAAEWHKMQTSIASLQALGVLKDPSKRTRRASLPAIPSQEKTRAVTGPPDINPEQLTDLLEGEEGLPRLGTAQLSMPTPPARQALKTPDASKFMKLFEQTQSMQQQAAATAPGGGGFARRGRRWTVVANHVHAMANIKPPEEDAKLSPSERSVNRNSVRLSNLPTGQRASTAIPQGSRASKVGNLDEMFDDDDLNLAVNAAATSSDARTWKGWYKIQSKVKTHDGEEFADATFGGPGNTSSVVDTLTSMSAKQTGASEEVIAAAESWQAIREESAAATEEHSNFADGLPPGVGKLAAVLVNRFGSLDRAFQNFDYNRKGKITRGQWQTVFATLRVDVQEITNIPSKKVFRMIAAVGASTSTLEVSIDQWHEFFQQELEGGECAFLLAEDRGSQAPKRWAQMRKMAPKALKALVEHVDEVEKERSALRRYISGEDGADPANLADESSSDSEDSNSSSDGEGSRASRRKQKRGSGAGKNAEDADDSSNDGEGSSSRARTERDNSATASSAVAADGFGEDGDVARDASSSSATGVEATAAGSETGAKSDVYRSVFDFSDSSDSDGNGDADGKGTSTQGKKAPDAKHSGVDARRVNRDKVMKAFQERDDTAIAQLNEDELQALAEQVQLQEEIEQFDLSSIDAFAYVLLAKLGSFKRAFNWFDFNCSKKITNVTWDTGILLLHVDTEKLTGLKPGQIFYRMDTCTEDPPTGMITRKKWKLFFSGFKIPEELLKQLEEGRTLRKRAAARARQYRRRGSLFRGDRGQRLAVTRRDTDDLADHEETEEERRLRLAHEEENYREWVERELAAIGDGDFRDYSDAVFRGGAESLLNPFRRRQIMLQVAEAYGLYTLSPVGLGIMPPRNSTSLERAPGVVDSITLMPEPGCMRIYNFKSFSAAMIAKLESINKGGRLAVTDMTFTEAQKALVHLLAVERTLVAVFDKWGSGERLVVHDTGSFASGLNSQLDSLAEGDGVSLASNLSNIEMKYVHAQAAKMGLTVVRQKNEQGEDVLKVFNMSEFANTVKEKLSDVGVGSRAVFKNLCIQEREVVHNIAREMGLHATEGEGGELKNVVVSSSVEFLAEQAARMSQAAEKGRGDFIIPQTAQQQQEFWAMADKNGLEVDTSYHGLKGRADFKRGDVVRLMVPKSRDGSSASDGDTDYELLRAVNSGAGPGGAERADAQADEDGVERGVEIEKSETIKSPTMETSSELIRQAFDAYASGNFRGERTFLRYVDLKEFAGDLRNAMPGRKTSMRDFGIILELCFDDTAQLQSDFGIRCGPGLTHQFFQVFIQKAMSRLGLQVASVLFEVLNEHT